MFQTTILSFATRTMSQGSKPPTRLNPCTNVGFASGAKTTTEQRQYGFPLSGGFPSGKINRNISVELPTTIITLWQINIAMDNQHV